MRQLKRAWREADRILDEHSVARAPVNVTRIAKQYAQVIETPLDDEISGMLIPDAGSWVIAVNANHALVRRRFTLAHELGHLRLHDFTAPHADGNFKIRFRDERSSKGSAIEEIEANQFAAELLMPRRLVLGELEGAGLDYASAIDPDSAAFAALVKRLAATFEVSQQALTIRLSSILV